MPETAVETPLVHEWKLWHVEVSEERSADAYIWAPDEDAAKVSAEELDRDILDGDYPETDVHVWRQPVEEPPKQTMVWTGGPEGEWVPSEEWVRPQPPDDRPKPGPGQRDIYGGEV